MLARLPVSCGRGSPFAAKATLEHVVDPRDSRHHSRKSSRGQRKKADLTDLVALCARFDRAARVGMNGTLETQCDCHPELDELNCLLTERTCLGGQMRSLIIGPG